MKERGIIFGAPMVRAILDGRKTQTRRIAKPRHPFFVEDGRAFFDSYVYAEPECVPVPCPYGAPGDRLYVKEAHALLAIEGEPDLCCAYRATCQGDAFDFVHGDGSIERIAVKKWRPSIHMPRWASRITLEVTEVRVERLQEISEEDAAAEGIDEEMARCDGECGATPCSMLVPAFERLWSEINGRESWNANPWVWAITFKRMEERHG